MLKKRKEKILELLRKAYPQPTMSLDFKNIFELLVATILSAQCTDKQVNKVTPELFRCFSNASRLAKADLLVLEKIIYGTGFYKNKAKHLKAMSKILISEFSGKVPNKMEDLLKLPGVARKTANVVLNQGYGIAEGIVVDTHVKRLSNRLGISTASSPLKIEKELMEILPTSEWGKISLRLISHGRKICLATNPKCQLCLLVKYCKYASVFTRA